MPKTNLSQNDYVIKLRDALIEQAILYIKGQAITQAEAANLMGVSQPRISDLMRRKNQKFSIDMLVTMLDRVDIKVKFTV
jgi:predicted XRE-type DNA-binding protein